MRTLIFFLMFFAGFFLLSKTVFAQTYTFSPAAATKNIGEEFTVNINIDMGAKKTTGADLKITYDEDLLEVMKVENGDFFPEGGYNASDGIIYVSYGEEQSLSTKTGSGIFSKITLKGKKAGTVVLTVVCSGQTTDSNIWDEGGNDIIDCTDIDNPSFTMIAVGTGGTSATTAPTATATPPVSGITLPTVFGLGVGFILTVMGAVLII